MKSMFKILLFFTGLKATLGGFDPGTKTNLAVYWGQNSAGGTGGTYQKRLSTYCADQDIDIINLTSRMKAASATIVQSPFRCPEIEADIKECQSKNKTVLLSLGGANSSERGFTDKAGARVGAERSWQMFGSSEAKKDIIRPFGSASVDGFDFDFEHGFQNIAAFRKALREKMQGHTTSQRTTFYLSAAPACKVPDPAGTIQEMLGFVQLDMVFVQFYNHAICDVRAGPNLKYWNDWAKGKNTTLFVGLPAKEQAAPFGGYVPLNKLTEVLRQAKSMEHVRGAMLWDASQAWHNNEYHRQVKQALKGS